jgi:hypothetical protein
MPTKAELEQRLLAAQRQVKALEAQQRTWGNEALALAKRKGYCNDIQEFLDEQKIPYDVPNVLVTVNVSFKIEAEMADAQMGEDGFTTDFLETCFQQEAFEQFGWRDAHDNDIKEITSVVVDYFEVTAVEKN